MNPEVLSKAQALLDEDLSCSQVANELKIKRDTLIKAVTEVKKWGTTLAKEWMEDEPGAAGTLYIEYSI